MAEGAHDQLHLSDKKSVIHLEAELELSWCQDDDIRSSAEIHSRDFKEPES